MKIKSLERVLTVALVFTIASCSLDDSGSLSSFDPVNLEIKSFQCSSRSISVENPPSRVVVLGNSLLMGNETFGLSASDSTKDYFYQLDSAFRKVNPQCVSTRVMAKNLELIKDTVELEEGLEEILVPNLSDSVDLVIVQLGDNIEESETFSRITNTADGILGTVCEHSPHAKVVWVGEWYATDRKQYALEKVATAHNVQFIDISDIKSEKTQGRVGDIVTFPDKRVEPISYKSYIDTGDSLTIVFEEEGEEYQATIPLEYYHDYPDESRLDLVSHYGIVVDAMAASHPNDLGFKLIAERILNELGF